ncbi:MAG: zinc ribbon domain-containing protein [Anaerolineae bacterium]|jgi:hypothetical protein|nr:zinc ribbon domain-containing protein [Anaerolineae bacterium]
MTTETRICPFCQAEVENTAFICGKCGHHFDVEEDGGATAAYLITTEKMSVPYRWLMVVACAILILGSLLPWGMLSAVSMTIVIKGGEGDGVLTAGVGTILLVVALLSEKHSKDRRLAMIAGGVFSMLILMPKLLQLIQAPGFETQVYPGIILAIFGALLLVLSAVIVREKAVAL